MNQGSDFLACEPRKGCGENDNEDGDSAGEKYEAWEARIDREIEIAGERETGQPDQSPNSAWNRLTHYLRLSQFSEHRFR